MRNGNAQPKGTLQAMRIPKGIPLLENAVHRPPPPFPYSKLLMPRHAETIGEHSYGKIHIFGEQYLDLFSIGKFTSIGSSVSAIVKGHNHNADWFTTYPFGSPHLEEEWPGADQDYHDEKRRGLTIGSDVWLGQESVFMLGDLTIGHGAIVGARTIVTKDVPPYAVVAGNPARIIKNRFPDWVIEHLLSLAWWDKPDEWIQEHKGTLCSDDLEALMRL